MKTQNLLVRISLVLTLLLLVAAVAVGCGEAVETTAQATAETSAIETSAQAAAKTGEYKFTFTATFADGTSQKYDIATDCETVGEALLKENLIAGEDGQYGLMVTTVCGVVADYNIDQTYWALYVDGEYGTVGVDSLKCADVTNVEFRVQK